MREWALWGVRNLCEGSEAARTALGDLQVVDTVQSPELTAAGFRLEHDPATHKISLVKSS